MVEERRKIGAGSCFAGAARPTVSDMVQYCLTLKVKSES